MLATFGWLSCLNRLGSSNSLLPSVAVQHLLLLLYQELRTGCSTRGALPATMLGMLSLLGMLLPAKLVSASKGSAIQVLDLCCCIELILAWALGTLTPS